MQRNYRKECLQIIADRYHKIAEVFPSRTPADNFRMVDTNYPTKDFGTQAALATWLVAVADFRISVTQPALARQYGVQLEQSLFDKPIETDPDINF